MTATYRLTIIALVAGLALGPVPAFAQDPPPADAPATTNQGNSSDQVGPRELRNFSLPGTVTRPAETQAAPVSPSRRRQPPPPAASPRTVPQPATTQASRTVSAPERPALPPPVSTPPIRSGPKAPPRVPPAATVTVQLPPVGDSPTDSASAGKIDAPTPVLLAPRNDVPLPWLFAAALLLTGFGAYLWRHRRREALAGGPDYEAFEAAPPLPLVPEPRPDLPPPAAPRRPSPAVDDRGLISTRLRPWLDLAFHPMCCRIDDENVTIEFELTVFNSGSTAARAILVEASYFNAGENQDHDIGLFFANPVGAGGRAVTLAPLKQMTISSKVVTPRAHVREYEVGARLVFVPLIGFNALYRWGSGEGQTSVSYILGRHTEGSKLAPFRLDMVDREFRALGERPLPSGVRR